MHTFWLEDLKGRHHLEDLRVGGYYYNIIYIKEIR
jgi:hypothetical protein